MHELGITQSIVEIAIAAAREQHAAKVLSVTVEIGKLSGVVPEAVEFCYEACTQQTLLEGSRLIIRQIDGRARCDDCGVESAIDNMTYNCSACGSYALRRLCGEELSIKELEIE